MNYVQFLENTDAEDSIYLRALYAQAVHETGRFTSSIYKNANNMFGMRPAQTRTKFYDSVFNTGSGEYASYSNLALSLADRIDLDKWNKISLPDHDTRVNQFYTDVWNKGYATDPNYVSKATAVFNQIFPYNIPINGELIKYAGIDFTDDFERPVNADRSLPESGSTFGVILLVILLGVGLFFGFKK